MRNPQQIFKRSLIIGQIAHWGLAKTLGMSLDGAVGPWAKLMTKYDLLDELTETEHELSEALMTGQPDPQFENRASWYCEGLSMCLWVLGLAEAPPVDSDVSPAPVVFKLMDPVPAFESLTLRSRAACRAELLRWFWIHRRLHAFVRGVQRCDLAEWIARTPAPEGEVEGLELLEGDLAFDGEPLFECAVDQLPYGGDYITVTGWRLRVIKWVCGLGDDFDAVDACPHALELAGPCPLHLYESSSPPAELDELDAHGGRALNRAAHHGELEQLTTDRKRLDARDIDGNTALHCALEAGQLEAATQLLTMGADGKLPNGEGRSPLVQAIHANDVASMRVLIEAGVSAESAANQDPPIFCALQDRRLDTLELLLALHVPLEVRNGCGQTPLLFALQERQWACVDRLLEAGADPSATDQREQTALHWAAGLGALEHVWAFIDHGLPLDARSASGFTPLALAILNDHPECALELLERGADVTIATGDGQTTLLLAAHGGHLDLVELLIERGVPVDGANEQGIVPLIGAVLSRDPQIVACLLEAGADPRIEERQGLTPLHYAASAGEPEMVRMLLERGADVDALSNQGMTPLIAASRGYGAEVIELLIEAGATLDFSEQQHGATALHFAACGTPEIVEALLAAGADASIEDSNGETALDWALARDEQASAALLRAAASGN